MAVEMASRMGTLWICYGPMPALTRMEGTLIPVEPVHVTKVISNGDQGITKDIHNSFPDGRVLLGVIGGYPIRPTRETASRILNMRASQHKKPVVGHFPGPIKNADIVVKNRFIESNLAHMMYRNTLSPETVPTLMTRKEYAKAVAEGAVLGRNVRIIENATEGITHRQLMAAARVWKGKDGKGTKSKGMTPAQEKKRQIDLSKESDTYRQARRW